jgi:hypothetical protein
VVPLGDTAQLGNGVTIPAGAAIVVYEEFMRAGAEKRSPAALRKSVFALLENRSRW